MIHYERLIKVAPQLKLPEEYQQPGVEFEQSDNLASVLPEVDVLYVTRIQKERFPSEEEYRRLKGSYIIDSASMKKLKTDTIVMHPLPRVDEIAAEVDADPRAAYFRQAKNGLYLRMALLSEVLK